MRITASIILLGVCVLHGVTAAQSKPAAAAQSRPALKIAKDTTYLTEPLGKDGRPDYLAYLNRKYSQGVTPQNNAAVLLLEAFDVEQVIPKEIRDRALALMKAKPSQDGQVKRLDTKSPWESVDKAMAGPWAEKDLPDVAAWLKANQAPLDKIVEASKRSRWYAPLVLSRDDLPIVTSSFLWGWNCVRTAAKGLVARANLEIGRGDPKAAMNDILAVMRLSGVMDQDSFAIGRLIGLALDRLADDAVQRWACSGLLDEKAARFMLTTLLDQKPKVPTLASAMGNERLSELDMLTWLATRPPAQWSPVVELFSNLPAIFDMPKLDDELRKYAVAHLNQVDPNVILRRANRLYDLQDRYYAASFDRRRNDILAAMDKAIKAAKSGIRPLPNAGATDAQVTQWAGDLLISLTWSSLPLLNQAAYLPEAAVVRRQLTLVCLAVAADRARTGKLPKSLEALSPAYAALVKAARKDPYSGKDLIYRPAKGTFAIYSVGPNGRDDGGNWVPGNADKDDIASAERAVPPSKASSTKAAP